MKHWTEERDQSVLEDLQARHHRDELRPLTEGQGRYFKAIETSTITVCTGPAGTGKTYMAAGIAAQMLRANRIERIVISRPLAECDESVGTEPGTMMEKVAGMMQPLMEAFGDFFTRHELNRLAMEEKLMVVPLAKMRGRTFKNAVVILDEAQNATYRQLKMFLTRFGKGAKVIVNGDHSQSDLPRHGSMNPLLEVVTRFQRKPRKEVGIVTLGREDIVRHELIQWVDETLSEPMSPKATYWVSAECPECNRRFHYEQYVEEDDLLVECCHCQACVELLDDEGHLNPGIVDDHEPDYFARKRKPHGTD